MNGGGSGKLFEVGRAVVRDLFGDRSIGLNADWPSTAALRATRMIDCGGDCSLTDKFIAGASGLAPLSTSIPKYAQRILTDPGKYIHSVDLNLTSTLAGSATATIYEAPANSTVPVTATLFSGQANLFSGQSGTVTFDLHSNLNGYLQMQSNTNYWIVLSVPTSVSGQVNWVYSSGSGTAGNAQFASSSWAPMSANDGFDFRIGTCAN